MKKAKKLWKQLQDIYTQRLNINESTTEQDAGTENNFEMMEFLIPYMDRSSSDTTLLNVSPINTAECMENVERTINLEVNENDEEQQISNASRNKRKRYDKMTELLQKKIEEKSLEIDVIDKMIKKRSSEINLIREELLNKERKKYMKIFFKSMYEMSVNLPESLQIKIEHQLFNSVMEAREKTLQEQTSSDNC